MTVRVAINGFGRIGRNILRAIAEAERKASRIRDWVESLKQRAEIRRLAK